jgi:hypothetical protein
MATEEGTTMPAAAKQQHGQPDPVTRVQLSEHDADLIVSALLEESDAAEDPDWRRDTIALAARIQATAASRWPGFRTSAEMYRPELAGLRETSSDETSQ